MVGCLDGILCLNTTTQFCMVLCLNEKCSILFIPFHCVLQTLFGCLVIEIKKTVKDKAFFLTISFPLLTHIFYQERLLTKELLNCMF